MNTREVLAEIKGLDVYTPEQWDEYAGFFQPEDRPGRTLMAHHNGGTLWRRVAGREGRTAVPSPGISEKVVTVKRLAETLRATEMTLGIVSGSYDLLHLGHLREMASARQFISGMPRPVLCALVLSDEAISAKKGNTRPVLDINERADMLAAVQCLDYVIVLTEPDCVSAISALKPQFFFKRAADDAQSIVLAEKALVERYGGRVVASPDLPERAVSTSDLVRTISELPRPADHASLGFQSAEMREFPNIVNLEVCRGRCPCRCVHCPVGSTEPSLRATRFGSRDMDLPLFRRIAEEVAQHPWSSIRIHAVGEPLYWPELRNAARIAGDMGITSWLFTSAVTKDRELLDLLCDNLSIIEVSVNSVSGDDYAATKGVDAFDLVAANIEHMSGRIKSSGLPSSLIVSRVQSKSETADAEFVSYWKSTGLVSDAFVRSFHTYNELMSAPSERNPHTEHEPCLVHWARFNISVDGKAVVCFNELFKERLNPSLVLGDVSGQSIGEIWHGRELSALRHAELSGDYSGLPCSDDLPCRECLYCQPLRGDGTTSEHQLRRIARGRP